MVATTQLEYLKHFYSNCELYANDSDANTTVETKEIEDGTRKVSYDNSKGDKGYIIVDDNANTITLSDGSIIDFTSPSSTDKAKMMSILGWDFYKKSTDALENELNLKLFNKIFTTSSGNGGTASDAELKDKMIKMLALMAALSESTQKNLQEAIKVCKSDLKKQMEETMKKLNEAMERAKKLAEQSQVQKALSITSAVMTGLVGVAMFCIGAIAIATGVGAVAGVAACAVGVMMIAMAIDNSVAIANESESITSKYVVPSLGKLVWNGPLQQVQKALRAVGWEEGANAFKKAEMDENAEKITGTVILSLVMIGGSCGVGSLAGGSALLMSGLGALEAGMQAAQSGHSIQLSFVKKDSAFSHANHEAAKAEQEESSQQTQWMGEIVKKAMAHFQNIIDAWTRSLEDTAQLNNFVLQQHHK